MPIYTTVANVYNLYPRIGSMTTISSSSIAFFIDQAEAEVNGYLGNNYSLPFSSTIPIIETISTEFSVVKILERFFTQEIGSKNEWVEARYENIYNTLSAINSGNLALVTNSNEVLTYQSEGGIHSNTQNFDPTFSVINDIYQQTDGDRLQDDFDKVRDNTYKPELE